MVNRFRLRTGLAIVSLAVAATFYGLYLLRYTHPGWDSYVAMDQDEGDRELALKGRFLSDTTDSEQRYKELFDYFLSGAVRYSSPLHERIFYPGAPSGGGYQLNGLEGFARTGTLLAAWIASGRERVVVDAESGQRVDLVEFLKSGVLTGTNPEAAEYWGRIRDFDQRLIEAADIARIVWMTRETIWQKLDAGQQTQIANWLEQTSGVATHDNNWLLFPVTVAAALKALGRHPRSDARALYDHYKSFYRESGWFWDDPGVVDYYNAWGIDYELFWIDRLDPTFDPDFIRQTMRQSADLTSHLIGPAGIPIMGRSVCYRTAVPVPIIAESLLDPDAETEGLAHRALDAVWRHFIAHGSLRDGALTQGYYGTDLRFVDQYTGAGSCHWGLRSLVLALFHDKEAAFWAGPEVPLPIERGDYRMEYDKLGWIISGRKSSGEIRIEIPKNQATDIRASDYSWWRKMLEVVVRRPLRPENRRIKYERPVYTSARFFGDAPPE